MTDYISQNELEALPEGELRLRLFQLFNALAAKQDALRDYVQTVTALELVRKELRKRRATPFIR
ncbi:MAG: hypothetical protein JSS82_09945 [Bacteroidetes bacterium]|nr:hypothetical protein [Bacteroidota bacterium]